MSRKTSLTCWKAACGKIAGLENFYDLIHTVYFLFFRFNQVPRNLLYVVNIVLYLSSFAWYQKQMLQIFSKLFSKKWLIKIVSAVLPFTGK